MAGLRCTIPPMSNPSALQILHDVFGYSSFRGKQQAVVAHVTAGGDALVLMPTGGGKSLCYQLPALLRAGVAIVVSPLIALMQDQVDALKQLGVRAAFLNSSQDAEEARAITAQLMRGELQIVYVAPERLLMSGFLALLDQLNSAPLPSPLPRGERELTRALRCLRLMRRIVFRSGGMIFGLNIASLPCCTSAFRTCRALR
jgi:hypothetical protein